MNAPFRKPIGAAPDPDLVELVKALARAAAARDIAAARQKDSAHDHPSQ